MTNQQKMILLEYLFNKSITILGISWEGTPRNLYIKYIDGGGNLHRKMFSPEGKSITLKVQ